MWNTTGYQIEIVFIRHGKTPGNEEKRYIGRTDENLSELGKQELLCKTYPDADLVFASPMRRCIETAKMIYACGRAGANNKKNSNALEDEYKYSSKNTKCEECTEEDRGSILEYKENGSVCTSDIVLINNLREINFGDFEGKNYKELSGDARYQAWIDSGGEMRFPNGESKQTFIERSLLGIKEMVQITKAYMDSRQVNKIRIAAVVHGGTIMAALSELYGGSYYDYQVKNCEGYWGIMNVSEEDIKITDLHILV